VFVCVCVQFNLYSQLDKAISGQQLEGYDCG